MDSVGKVLRDLRGDTGLRVAAKRAGLSATHLSDVERGRRFPSRAAVEALVTVYASKHQRRPILLLIERAVAAHFLNEWNTR